MYYIQILWYTDIHILHKLVLKIWLVLYVIASRCNNVIKCKNMATMYMNFVYIITFLNQSVMFVYFQSFVKAIYIYVLHLYLTLYTYWCFMQNAFIMHYDFLYLFNIYLKNNYRKHYTVYGKFEETIFILLCIFIKFWVPTHKLFIKFSFI